MSEKNILEELARVGNRWQVARPKIVQAALEQKMYPDDKSDLISPEDAGEIIKSVGSMIGTLKSLVRHLEADVEEIEFLADAFYIYPHEADVDDLDVVNPDD